MTDLEKPVRRRTLKIESDGDGWKGKIKPKIRLCGHWLEQAGFKPGHRVEISSSKSGEMSLQFKEECPKPDCPF
jgi:hypothetical protein